MTWAAKTANQLPKVLVGPILRKVTPNSVSVFLVTKDGAAATLKIFMYGEDTPIMQVTSTPTKFGEYFYAQTITVICKRSLYCHAQ
jgi:hypothetical protein